MDSTWRFARQQKIHNTLNTVVRQMGIVGSIHCRLVATEVLYLVHHEKKVGTKDVFGSSVVRRKLS